MRCSLRALAHRLLFFVPLSLATACGSYETTKIKDYRLHVVDGTAAQVATFKALVADFNRYSGETVLNYVDNADDANSPIIITHGLKAKTGDKVGLGQWMTNSEQDSPVNVSGSRPKKVVRFSMRLEFDLEYLQKHTGNDEEATYARQKLFFHEVGHGLELNHSDTPRDLMYSEISGQKDFSTFFRYVRSYMSDQ